MKPNQKTDPVRQAETLLSRVMCVDRPRLIREIRYLKQQGKRHKGSGAPPPDEKKRRRAEQLLDRARRSQRRRRARMSSVPDMGELPDLPITRRKDEIVAALKQHRVVIIAGDTGSGKTTQIPKYCMMAGRGGAGVIGCTQPRRIAAMTVARRLAEELGEPLGQSVGYKIRFDDRSGEEPLVKVMTDGILLAETQKDPWLNTYDTLIVDEAHERSLNIDFTLGILRNLVRRRRDLTLVITSATIDTEKFSKAFDDAPVIEVSGRMYPVEVRYQPVEAGEDGDPDDQGYVEAAVAAVDGIHRESRRGDILMFMPTEQDITDTIEMLRGRGYPGMQVLPLYARLSAREQAKVFSRGPGRKVVVSTNVAETSLTIPGITYVVDTGLARIPHYSPRTRTTGLPVTPISRSSADQRKGRCGRTANGVCIRLYDEESYGKRPLFTSPEILRSNLAEVILRMVSLKLGDVGTFPFVDPPAPKSVKDGFDTLVELGAIRRNRPDDDKKKKSARRGGDRSVTLTEKGRVMAGIPVDPKLSRILIEAEERGCLEEAVIIASALSIADPRQRPQDKAQQADQKHALFKDPASDFVTLLNIWKAFDAARRSEKSRSGVRRFCKDHFLSFKRIMEWMDIHRQIRSILGEHGIDGRKPLDSGSHAPDQTVLKKEAFSPLYVALHQSLLTGFLAHIARKKEGHLFQAAKGQTAMIFPGSGVFKSAGDWIVAAEYVETSRLFARSVANIDPAWLEDLAGELCTRTVFSPRWEKKRGEVVATEQVSLFGLVIVPERRISYGPVHPTEAGEIFIRSALVEGEVPRPFGFMLHNQALLDEVQELEEKTRSRDILASPDDLFMFYRDRLDRDFFNLRTFARYLKKKGDDAFLRMTKADIQKSEPEPELLSQLPDTLEMGQNRFELAYAFQPGKDSDGVTLKVPSVSAGSIRSEELGYLVPGMFEEKITALIRGLPKQYRKQLVPVTDRAGVIAREMPRRGRPLFSELSRFIHQRFGVQVPATAWSEDDLPDHLKMRISIRDDQDREVTASRDDGVLRSFARSRDDRDHDGLHQARKRHERTRVLSWDFGDLPESIGVTAGDGVSFEMFPALVRETTGVAIRLFKDRATAVARHGDGIRALFEQVYPKEVDALLKDLRRHHPLGRYRKRIAGEGPLDRALLDGVLGHLLAPDIRKAERFEAQTLNIIPRLYDTGQQMIRQVERLCEAREQTEDLLDQIHLRNLGRAQVRQLIKALGSELDALVPEGFVGVYGLDRLDHLNRYVSAIGIRARRGAEDPARDREKARLVDKYTDRLSSMVAALDPSVSPEKAQAVEDFFWMVEEYKVSLFAQELGTAIKVSPKRLDKKVQQISLML